MSTYDFGMENYPGYLARVEESIQVAVPESLSGLSRVLAARGKKLRPGLVIAVAHYSGNKIDDRVIDAAAAVELVHLASLIHDDIMDNGTVRHGAPTIHAKEGVDYAILAGDYLFSRGCALAAGVSAEAGIIMAETIMRLCEGQALELKDTRNTQRTVESLNTAIKGKTSSLFNASVRLGGLVSGLDESELAALSDFADNFGIAYQYLDDVNDFAQQVSAAGKSAGNDIREGNYTLPVLLSMQGPSAQKLEALMHTDAPVADIVRILENDESLQRTTTESQAYKQKALHELSRLKNQRLAHELKNFTGFYL